MTAVSNAVANLTESRTKLVAGVGKVGEYVKGYAIALNQAFDLVDNAGNITSKWYELSGKLKAGVKAERDNFKADMERAGYSKATTDVYWQRVKEASGYVTAGNRVKGATDTDGKTAVELKTIINRILKAEENGEECHASTIVDALKVQYKVLTGEAFNANK